MPRRVKDISAQRLRNYDHAPGPGRELHFTTTVIEGPVNTTGCTVETQLTKDEVTSLLICLVQNSGYEHLMGDILRLIGDYRSERTQHGYSSTPATGFGRSCANGARMVRAVQDEVTHRLEARRRRP
jgi:hypothetical protein